VDAANSSSIPNSDSTALMQRVAATKEGREVLLSFLADNYGKDRVTASAFASVVSTMSLYVSNTADIQTVSISFMKQNRTYYNLSYN
jgi:hypothetical protein